MTYEIEERAAILEFDGGWPRDKAEIRAKQEIRERQKHEANRRANHRHSFQL